MAKLKAVLGSLDGLTDEQQQLYTPGDDGKFYLDIDDIDDHSSVKGLKNALGRLKTEEKRLKDVVSKLPEGVSPEEIQALLDERATREEEKAKAAGKWDDLKNQLTQQHQKQLSDAQKQIAARETYIRELVLQNEAVRVLTEAGATKSGVRLLLPHVMSSLDAVPKQDGDKFVMEVSVRGADGKPRLSPAGNGSPMGIVELVQEMRKHEDFALGFEGTTSGGSGASQSTTPGSGGVRSMADLKTPADKASYIKQHGLEAFNALLTAEQPTSPFSTPSKSA